LLSALPNKIIVPNVVELELDNDRSRSTGEYQFVQELITTGAATLASLTDDESVEYLKLVSTLDDGEAATIALAAARGLSPIIDEQKGQLVAEERCRSTVIGCSFDLFRHPHALIALGSDAVEALYFALHDGRMRIHHDRCDETVSLIGVERALRCSCLPGYKIKRPLWQAMLASPVSVSPRKL
jgi:hypothetical protein